MRLNKPQWELYAILRKYDRTAAEDYKRKIRQKTTYTIETENPWKVVFADYDSILKKRFFPYFFTEEEWEEFMEDTWVNIYSPYDCTGQLFTRGLERYTTNNGTWVYHSMSFDV